LTLARPVPAAAAPDGRVLDEAEATAWLARRGVPFARQEKATDADAAIAAAQDIGYPVVLKGRGAAHKSEHGFVVVGIADDPALRREAERMLAAGATGLLVCEQVTGGVELLVGVSTDPVLGPVVAVGSGGVTAEALRDVALGVLPLTRTRARRMLASLRIAPLLAGWRGQPAVDAEAVVDVLMTVAEIGASGAVAELDINPLLARPEGVVGLDALLRLAASGDPS
jgi:acyl-CoA synthetase (NDP forming)